MKDLDLFHRTRGVGSMCPPKTSGVQPPSQWTPGSRGCGYRSESRSEHGVPTDKTLKMGVLPRGPSRRGWYFRHCRAMWRRLHTPQRGDITGIVRRREVLQTWETQAGALQIWCGNVEVLQTWTRNMTILMTWFRRCPLIRRRVT